jgi:hypothetical protein
MAEHTVTVVKAYSVGKPDSLVVVIPKEVQDKIKRNLKGRKFLVKVDERDRVIYEPLEMEKETVSA